MSVAPSPTSAVTPPRVNCQRPRSLHRLQLIHAANSTMQRGESVWHQPQPRPEDFTDAICEMSYFAGCVTVVWCMDAMWNLWTKHGICEISGHGVWCVAVITAARPQSTASTRQKAENREESAHARAYERELLLWCQLLRAYVYVQQIKANVKIKWIFIRAKRDPICAPKDETESQSGHGNNENVGRRIYHKCLFAGGSRFGHIFIV